MGPDSATAALIDGTRLFAFVQAVFWVSLRVGAAIMAAPPLGTKSVPMRVRVILALLLSTLIAPMLPAPPSMDSLPLLAVAAARELAVGVSMGFMLRLAFEAAMLAGELVAQGMALSFAQMADPLRNGQHSALLGQWFNLAFGLLFFAFGTHLALISTVAQSYQHLPVGTPIHDAGAFVGALPTFFASAMQAGVRLALPVTAAMLAVNVAFGLMSKSAPALNPIALGLPVALLFGMLLARLMGGLATPVGELFTQALQAAAGLAP